MPHQITAIILKGKYSDEKLEVFDLRPIKLTKTLTMFHINGYYTACWQSILRKDNILDTEGMNLPYMPTEECIATIVSEISLDESMFAIIQTDYFGGIGDQYACVFRDKVNLDKSISRINEALKTLGVQAELPLDEFDTVGLSKHRSEPDYLSKYTDLADILGV